MKPSVVRCTAVGALADLAAAGGGPPPPPRSTAANMASVSGAAGPISARYRVEVPLARPLNEVSETRLVMTTK